MENLPEEAGKSLPVPAREREFYLTRPFLLLWFEQLAFFISFMSMMSAMPLYVTQLGASPLQVGLISGLFSIAAMFGRLYVGRFSDRGRKIPVLAAAAVLFILITAAYALIEPAAARLAIPAVVLILVLRLPHGLAMASSTAGQALTAELAPPSRQGEALNLYALTPTLATAFFPGLGMALASAAGYPALFWACSASAALALLLALLNHEPALLHPGQHQARLFNTQVILPGIVLFCLQFAFGTVIAFLPVYAAGRGLANPGFFFLAYALAMMASQTVTGRVSDRRGRLTTILPGLALAGVGILLAAFARGWFFAAAGAVFGAGIGAAQQILIAWAGEMVPRPQRGSAIATMGLFLDGGISAAAFAGGLAAGAVGLQVTFLATGLIPLAGIAVAIYTQRRFQSTSLKG